MLSKANLYGFVASILLASVCVGGRAQGNQDPEAVAQQKMIGAKAPALNAGDWLNTDGKNLSMKGLQGKVVVLDFFTYH